jgi:hypothetical protein
VANWNDFVNPLIYLQLPEKFTLAVGLNYFTTLPEVGGEPTQHLLMAACVLSMLPTIIIFFLGQRFFVQGIVWLWLFDAAVSAVRRGDRGRHAHLMIAMVAVTTGAVWFRLMTGSAILIGLPFEPVYAAAAWVAWLAPLLVVMGNAERIDAWAFPALSRPLAPRAAIV